MHGKYCIELAQPGDFMDVILTQYLPRIPQMLDAKSHKFDAFFYHSSQFVPFYKWNKI